MRLYITMKQSALTDVIIYHYIKKYATKHHNSASQIIVNAQDHMVCKVTSSVRTTHSK